jgi:hypothetical protein
VRKKEGKKDTTKGKEKKEGETRRKETKGKRKRCSGACRPAFRGSDEQKGNFSGPGDTQPGSSSADVDAGENVGLGMG